MSEEGGDESPARLRRKIKKVVVLSATSESDSDESVGVAGTRRKRLRVISDEEASDSSGSSVVCAGTRRRRTLPKLRDSDADSDSSGRAQSGKANVSKAKTNSGFASDSSEGNSDKCSICLLRFTNQEIGTPETCEHIFCLDCIIEWSKNINTCPVDRLTFNSIIVRTCVGGRVLRTEAVRVVQRTSSVEALVVEDPTLCELCGSMESEETMLLCDGCDLGFHMHCLNPPLSEVPAEQWLCPNCYVDINDEQELLDTINLSEVEDLFDGIIEFDLPTGPRPTASRQQRNVRRSSRNIASSEQPSSSRNNLSSNMNEPPTTSHSGRSSAGTSSRSANRRRTTTRRRKYKRRRTKTVIIEYEVQENGKFPITKKIKRRVKKRRVKRRQPRTAARRSYVRASVQAKLASQRLQRRDASAAGAGGGPLSVRRHRAGIPALSLMGNPNELDYFADEDNAISEDASTAVAVRPAANIFSAYRQARRKIVAIPSPSHASSAPDLLSDILESQTLLHSKNSLVSVTVDGNINIKLQTQKRNGQRASPAESGEGGRVDLSKAEESARCAPSYPGQGRGGGWAGGYRGGHGRDRHHADGGFGRGAGYGAGHPGRPSGYGNHHNGGMRRDEPDYYDAFPRRPPQYANADDSYYERTRRPPADGPRGGFADHHRADGRHGGPAPYARHSFGGFENPVDMRMSHTPQPNATIDSHPPAAPATAPPPPPVQDEPRPASRHSQCSPTQRSSTQSSPTQQASTFGYRKTSEVEKSEDERSDPGLVIDTDKYDPTEPTRDDDSGDEEPHRGVEADVPPAVLGSAVRRALGERGAPLASPAADATRGESDDDSDGDCPNFSIYSAASVHIANYGSVLPDEPPPEPGAPAAGLEDGLEDLVQEDGDDSPAASLTASRAPSRAPSPAPSPASSPAAEISSPHRPDAPRPHATRSHYATPESNEKRKSEEEYKEKVSKRCPITTNTRNPIKIKLNTPSLIKRHVSLYDEEETSRDAAPEEKSEVNTKLRENRSRVKNESPKRERLDASVTKNKDIAANKGDSKQSEGSSETRERRGAGEKSSLSLKEKAGPDNGLSNDAKECTMSADDGSNVKIFDESTGESDCMSESEKREDENVDDLLSKELGVDSPKDDECRGRADDNLEKMTESISETEDERSYTPCLDENKPNRDASFETERDKGLDGLDTEMISEEEGNEMFSENERPPSDGSRTSPAAAGTEPGGGRDEKRDGKKTAAREENVKKKKKKDSKKESKDKDKGKVKKRTEIAFKKLSKSGKERNYRERDRERDEKKTERDRRDSGEKDARQRRRKEKRKDLQRYDVRSVVTEKRRRLKDPFGRDVSPRERSPSLSPPERSASSAPRSRRELSRSRRSLSRTRRSPSKARRSRSRPRRSFSRARGSPTEPRGSPSRARRSTSRGRRSPGAPRRTTSRSRRSPALRKSSPAAARVRRSAPRRSPSPRAPTRRSPARRKRRQSVSRPARRRSASASPPRRTLKKKKRDRSTRRAPAADSPERKRHRSASVRPEPAPPSPEPRPPSPRTPSPEPAPEEAPERPERRPRRRARDAPGGACKEVFTSGDNILVSVSFKDQERGEEIERRRRRDSRRERRRRRRAAVPPELEVAKPVAIIDLERSPFRELTPSPKNVIVLSDSDHGERSAGERAAPDGAGAAEAPPLGPKTPPEPAAPEQAAPAPPERTSPEPESRSPDAYDPFEPTRSASPASPSSPAAPEPPSAPGAAPSPPRTLITLEAAQRSNLSADEVLDRRPLSPVEKVMALLQSTRDASPEPPPGVPEPPPAPRIVLPSPTRAPPKLFPGKPSPIRSNPVKPMRAARLPRPAPPPPPEAGSSPYSPGSSDFGELFEPPPRRPRGPPRDRRRGKTQAGVGPDDDSLLALDELPSSAVAMQVKNKYLKKLNRQERVVEEVKLVLKPHYNKKRVTKEEYKDILRRAVPKICHNKSGEINPTKIQALVEAYVKKFRKRHKLGIAS